LEPTTSTLSTDPISTDRTSNDEPNPATIPSSNQRHENTVSGSQPDTTPPTAPPGTTGPEPDANTTLPDNTGSAGTGLTVTDTSTDREIPFPPDTVNVASYTPTVKPGLGTTVNADSPPTGTDPNDEADTWNPEAPDPLNPTPSVPVGWLPVFATVTVRASGTAPPTVTDPNEPPPATDTPTEKLGTGVTVTDTSTDRTIPFPPDTVNVASYNPTARPVLGTTVNVDSPPTGTDPNDDTDAPNAEAPDPDKPTCNVPDG
jgi:hypothetical protein